MPALKTHLRICSAPFAVLTAAPDPATPAAPDLAGPAGPHPAESAASAVGPTQSMEQPHKDTKMAQKGEFQVGRWYDCVYCY